MLQLPWTDREYGAVRKSPPPAPIIHTAPCESLRATSRSSRWASHSGCSDANCPRNVFLADRHSPNPIARRSAGVFRRSTSAIASSSTSMRRQSRPVISSPGLLPCISLPVALDPSPSVRDSSSVTCHSSRLAVPLMSHRSLTSFTGTNCPRPKWEEWPGVGVASIQPQTSPGHRIVPRQDR